MRKILSVILVISMLAILLVGCGEENFTAMTYGVYQYDVVKGKAILTDVDTITSGDLVIPATLGGYPVTAIGDNAFEGCSLLLSVTVPDGVTSIGAKAFSRCRKLCMISIPDSVTYLGESCFEKCINFIEITIPAKVKTIKANTFYACTALEKVYLNEKLTAVESCAFEDCSSFLEIFYPSSESKRFKISIESGNERLIRAAWHYNVEF